jgi:hypothetical protein
MRLSYAKGFLTLKLTPASQTPNESGQARILSAGDFVDAALVSKSARRERRALLRAISLYW